MAGGILPPLSVIASWPTPNYVNPVQRGWGLVIATITLSVLSFSMVCARLLARFKARNMGSDDWIIMISIVGTLSLFKSRFVVQSYLKLTITGTGDEHVGSDMSWSACSAR